MTTPVYPAGQKLTIWSKSFVIGTVERVLATFLMAFLAVITKTSVELSSGNEFDVARVDWTSALWVALGAALLSLIKCLIANLSTKDGPSLTHAEQTVPPLPAPAAS